MSEKKITSLVMLIIFYLTVDQDSWNLSEFLIFKFNIIWRCSNEHFFLVMASYFHSYSTHTHTHTHTHTYTHTHTHTYIYIYINEFINIYILLAGELIGCYLWDIKPYRLFRAKFFLYIYILNIYHLVWFAINSFRLFNANPVTAYIYIYIYIYIY